MLVVADARHFSAFLGGVIFVGQPAFGVRFDFERVRLYAIGGGDHLVVRLFGPSNPRCALCSVVSEGRLVPGLQNFGRTTGLRKRRAGPFDQAGKTWC
jgi:hypothetical protein